MTGYISEAKEYFFKAYEIDRDSAFLLSCLGGTESDLGNYVKAIEYFKRAYLNRSDYSEVIRRLGKCYLFIGQHDKALTYFREYIKLVPLDINPHVVLAHSMNGFRKEADQYFNARMDYLSSALESAQSTQNIGWIYYELACLYAFKGDKENAIKNLTLYSKNNKIELWLLTDLKNDPMLEGIRNEPAYRQIVTDMESKYQTLHDQMGKWLEDQGKLNPE